MSFRTINYLLVAVIVIVGVSSSLLTVQAVISYSPAVTAEQWAKYETLYDICKPANSPSCQGSGSLNDTAYGLIKIIGVSGTIVTFDLFTQYKNGTTSTMPAQVDVSSGVANVSSFGNGGPSDYFILAGGLAAPDPIWNTASAPMFNQTISEQFLGTSRTLNFLNHTITSSPYSGVSLFESTGFVFDQQSGLFVEVSFNATVTSPFGDSQTAFAIGMTDNNIWLSSSLPDFSIGPVASMTFATGSSDSTTVTITGDTGFTSKVVLTVDTPSGITCSLTPSSIQSSGSSRLTCNGQPGSYTLTVSASSGYSLHSVQTTATITAAADFSISTIPPIAFQTGSSGTSTITLTALNGFSSDITLSMSTTNGLTCTFDHNIIHGSGTAALTCNGQVGTYTVTITGSTGLTSHSAQTTITITGAADFSMGTIPSITIQSGSSGTATVTFTGQNGFSSDISLTLSVPSGLTCTLDHNVIHGSGTATLTCNGQPGTYTVKVDATSGSTSHSAKTNVTVNSSPVSNQPSNGLPLAYIYAGVAAAIVAAVAGIVFFVRRKPSSPQKPQTMAPA